MKFKDETELVLDNSGSILYKQASGGISRYVLTNNTCSNIPDIQMMRRHIRPYFMVYKP